MSTSAPTPTPNQTLPRGTATSRAAHTAARRASRHRPPTQIRARRSPKPTASRQFAQALRGRVTARSKPRRSAKGWDSDAHRTGSASRQPPDRSGPADPCRRQ